MLVRDREELEHGLVQGSTQVWAHAVLGCATGEGFDLLVQIGSGRGVGQCAKVADLHLGEGRLTRVALTCEVKRT
jgi:hypothetical protein